ncbi:MAG: lysylphosphatidylglycerol synthase domain-containing protein, partial [bacterium]
APALVAASGAFWTGALTLFTGYNKAFAEMTLLVAAIGILGVRALRTGRGLAPLLVAAAIGSATPTPGGLGAVEAALVAALSGYGMTGSAAVSSVLTFRLATYWLPMIPGWIMFQQMQRREEL